MKVRPIDAPVWRLGDTVRFEGREYRVTGFRGGEVVLTAIGEVRFLRTDVRIRVSEPHAPPTPRDPQTGGGGERRDDLSPRRAT
jgi:hypothetical protein